MSFWHLTREGFSTFWRSATYYAKRKKLDKSSANGKLYQIFVEKDATIVPNKYNELYETLHTLYHRKKSSEWLTMEFHGTPSGIRTYCWLSGGMDRQSIQSILNNVHPHTEIQEVDEDYVDVERLRKKITMCATLSLGNNYMFSLRQTTGDKSLDTSVISAICTAMQGIRDHENIGIQYVLRPIANTYRIREEANVAYNEYKEFGIHPTRRKYKGARLAPYYKFFPELINELGRSAKKRKRNIAAPAVVKGDIEEKITQDTFYEVLIRIYVSDTKAEDAKSRLDNVISNLAPSADKNYLRVFGKYNIPKWDWVEYLQRDTKNKFIQAYKDRRVHTHPIESYMSPAELTTICHLPNRYVPGVVRLKAKKLPVPDGVYQYNSLADAWRDKAIVFGLSNYRGMKKYLAFKDITMLMQHAYVIGGTGSGKSYWLSFIALQVATVANIGCTYYDIKGDVADELMQHLPKSEWDRVVYIDLQDMTRFMPINILKRSEGESIYNLAALIVDTFIQVFGEKSIQEHSRNVLRSALIAVASTDEQGTLLEVYRMFSDEPYILQTIGRMKEQGNNYDYPDVLAYWEAYYAMKPSGRKAESSAIVNKLTSITHVERPRFTFSQPENALNWRKMLDERKIILVNFAMDKNTELVLSFFGTVFTRFIRQAAFSRGDIPKNERVPHIFIMDEFQKFLSRPDDVVTMLELARSYGLGVVMAHQSLSQIKDKSLLDLITDNTFSQVCLSVGDGSGSDMAKILSTSSTKITGDDLQGQENFHGYARFKKLSPEPFTFKSLDMTEHFVESSMKELLEWKEQQKEEMYNNLDELRVDINERYARAREYMEALMEAAAEEEEATTMKQKEKVVALKGRKNGTGIVKRLEKGAFDQ